MWRLDHKVLHPPGPGRPRLVLLCCPYLEAILEKPASEVLSRLVWQVRPHLRFSQRSTAQTCARLRTGPGRRALGRRASGARLGLRDSLSHFPRPAERLSHVPWGAAGPFPSQSAAFGGSGAFPEEGEEGRGFPSVPGKALRGALRWRCRLTAGERLLRHLRKAWPALPRHLKVWITMNFQS